MSAIYDTSVWIDFFKGGARSVTRGLQQRLNGGEPVYLTPTIYQEVLQGIGDAVQYRSVKSLIDWLERIELPAYRMAEEAAAIYRKLRSKGVTIRKSNDCLIAAYAVESGLPVAHLDRDFDHIARHTKLKVLR